MKIQKSAEDYLETMLILKEEKGYIRSVDIADRIGVTKPSVSYAVKHLRENGYLTMDRSGFITLTDSGMAIATKIYSRHNMLTELFEMAGVNPETARDDACKVEHDISDETYEALSYILEQHKKHPEEIASAQKKVKRALKRKSAKNAGTKEN
ncbi:MAG: metal-dependent transcriptional regulator [Eubacteriales bacterium]|jgi:Mn-dependent DtxR family transcriptional regulator